MTPFDHVAFVIVWGAILFFSAYNLRDGGLDIGEFVLTLAVFAGAVLMFTLYWLNSIGVIK